MYETALVVELRHRNIPFVRQFTVPIVYRDSRGRAPPARPVRLGSGRRRAEGSPRVHARAFRGVEVVSTCRRPGAWATPELCEGHARDQARPESSAPRMMSDSLPPCFMPSMEDCSITPSHLDRRGEQVRRAPGAVTREGSRHRGSTPTAPRGLWFVLELMERVDISLIEARIQARDRG